MIDLSSRKEAIMWLKDIKRFIGGGDESFDEKRRMAIDMAIDALSVEPKKVKWISKMVTRDGEYAGWICSNCGYFTADSKACFYNYCPHCHAKMREDHDTD